MWQKKHNNKKKKKATAEYKEVIQSQATLILFKHKNTPPGKHAPDQSYFSCNKCHKYKIK